MLSFHPEPEPQEKALRAKAKEFGDKRLRPTLLADEAKEFFRRPLFSEMAKAGLTAIAVPKEYGGLGLPCRCHYAVLEELAKASPAYSITVGVTNLVQGALTQFGTPEQKEKFLKRLTSGEWLGAFSLSEPGSGSDAASLQTKAIATEGGYRLTGNKTWCSNGGLADVYLVMARTGEAGPKGISSFLVTLGTDGFRIGKKEKKLGLKTSTLTELVFEDCFVPASQRIGKEGEGFAVALSQLDAGRIGIAATGSGITWEAIEQVWRAGVTEKRFDFQEGAQAEFGAYFAKLQAIKALIALAADEKDRIGRVSALAASAKLLASDLSMEVSSQAVSTVGPLGALESFGLERLVRDAKALQIVEGTNQIQKLVLAKELAKRF